MQVHVVRVGDVAIATHPVALYLDFGTQIKPRSKAVQTFTIETADGHYRYLPTARSLAGSAYGAVPESIVNQPSDGPQGRLNYPDGFVSADRKWLPFAFDDDRRRAVYVAARLPEPKP